MFITSIKSRRWADYREENPIIIVDVGEERLFQFGNVARLVTLLGCHDLQIVDGFVSRSGANEKACFVSVAKVVETTIPSGTAIWVEMQFTLYVTLHPFSRDHPTYGSSRLGINAMRCQLIEILHAPTLKKAVHL